MSGILELASQAGLQPQRKASTHGGEYSSPCPHCFGENRFIMWPNRTEGPKFWCRQCGASGDEITFCREFLGMTFDEACRKTERLDKLNYRHSRGEHRLSIALHTSPPPANREPEKSPNDIAKWRKVAETFVSHAHENLMKDQIALDWLLRNRGISERSCRETKIGVIRNKTRCKVLEQTVVGPCIVVPSIRDGQVVYVKMRMFKGKSKYTSLQGGNAVSFLCGEHNTKVAVVVESELDAILIAQEVPNVLAIALGGASHKIDTEAREKLGRVSLALLALDFDKAGGEALVTLQNDLSNALPLACPYGKNWVDYHLSPDCRKPLKSVFGPYTNLSEDELQEIVRKHRNAEEEASALDVAEKPVSIQLVSKSSVANIAHESSTIPSFIENGKPEEEIPNHPATEPFPKNPGRQEILKSIANLVDKILEYVTVRATSKDEPYLFVVGKEQSSRCTPN